MKVAENLKIFSNYHTHIQWNPTKTPNANTCMGNVMTVWLYNKTNLCFTKININTH